MRWDLRERILRRFAGSQPQHELADWRVLGADADLSRRLTRHLPKDPVPAAVLVPLVDRPQGLTVLLTQRASQMARHAAQIAFPGGRVDPTDADVASAALREAQEEIGLDPGARAGVRLSTRSRGDQRFSRDAGAGAGDATVLAGAQPGRGGGRIRSAAGARARQRQSQGAAAARGRRGPAAVRHSLGGAEHLGRHRRDAAHLRAHVA